MNKKEILSNLDTRDANFLKDVDFDIKEDSITLTTYDSFVKDYIFPNITQKIKELTGKQVFGKLEIRLEENQDSISLFNRFGIVLGNMDLDRSLTKERLVIGDFNKRAVTAKDNLLDWQSDRIKNILTIWGGTGLGKTHILHTAGWDVVRQKKNIYLADSNRFIDEVLKYSKEKKLDSMHSVWNDCTMILFDDLQGLSEKAKKIPLVESELFNAIQIFTQPKKRCIFACDRNPLALQFDDRINYRLAENAVEITRPDKDARIEILKKLFGERSREIKKEFIDLLAEKLNQNVRQLMGAVNSINIQMELGSPIDEQTITVVIASLAVSPRAHKTDPLERIVNHVIMNMGIERNELFEKRSRNPARITAIAVARLLYPKIEVDTIAKFFNTSRKSVYEIAEREAKTDSVVSIMSLIMAEGR